MKLVHKLILIAAFFNCGSSTANNPQAPLQLENSGSSRNEIKDKLLGPLGDARATPLPDDIVPRSYIIKLRPILDPNEGTGDQWTAPGQVEIQVQPIAITNKIVFHRDATLTINEATAKVTGPNGQSIPIVNHTFAPADMFHTINLASDLRVGESYFISLDFIAPISPTTKGLYRAEYKDENGTEYRLAATQFEYSNARQAFPCFDEPRWKTQFTISLGYKNETYNTLSNSVKKVTAQPDPVLKGWVWDNFDVTVRMPTYLVAVVISNFDYLDAPEPVFGERPVRIYGEPRYIAPGGDKLAGGALFAANASAHILAFLEKKYVLPYEMPKMDSVAIPNPFFGPGAMENWGLNLYKENVLLFWEGEQGWANKEEITGILSHELAHQWFGNLVTCKTWDNLWLNEGFATYVQHFGVEELHPEFGELRVRLINLLQSALGNDVINSVPIHTEGAPGSIVYDKGGTIIRMMEGFLGPDTLTKGLVSYLSGMAYTAAEQDDLYGFLTAQANLDNKLPSGKTIKTIMDTWTLQAGFPLIRVSKNGENEVVVSQERFQPAAFPPLDEKYEVPIAIATQNSAVFSNHTPAFWLEQSEASKSFQHNTSEWIVVNPDAMGYYRVLYDTDLLQLIMNQLKTNRSAISGLSRSQLINDYFTLYEQGHLPIDQALDVTTFISNDEGVEDDFVVWYTLLNHLGKALSMFQAYNVGPDHSLKSYILPKIEEELFRVGFTQSLTDEGVHALYKARLLDWACALENTWCIVGASSLMTFWIINPLYNPFLVDTQPVMYCTAVAADGEPVFNFLLKQFEDAPVGTFKSHRSKLLNALACAKDAVLLERLLHLAIDNTSVIGKSPADSLNVFQRVAGNPIGRIILLRFLDDNFDEVSANLGGTSAVASILNTLSSYYTKLAELSAFQAFIANHQVLQGSVDGALQRIAENILWIAENYEAMDTWFAAHA